MLVSNLRDKRHLAYETLIRSRRRLWLPLEHPFLNRETITLSDVAAEPYVMLTVDEADETACKYWRPSGLRPQTIFTTSSVEAVRSMVAAGMGITILSGMVYRPWSLEGQRIDTRNVLADIPTMDVGLAFDRSRPPLTREQDLSRFPEHELQRSRERTYLMGVPGPAPPLWARFLQRPCCSALGAPLA